MGQMREKNYGDILSRLYGLMMYTTIAYRDRGSGGSVRCCKPMSLRRRMVSTISRLSAHIRD